MPGIPPEAFEFFARVAADTSLETVEANRGLWQRAVHEPVEELCAELADEFGPAKVYNLHRARNLWTHQYAYVTVCDTIVYGLALSLDGLAVEGGSLRMNSVQIARYRDAVRGLEGIELQRAVDALTAAGYEVLGEQLKRTPDHPRGTAPPEIPAPGKIARPRRVARDGRGGRARPCRMARASPGGRVAGRTRPRAKCVATVRGS